MVRWLLILYWCVMAAGGGSCCCAPQRAAKLLAALASVPESPRACCCESSKHGDRQGSGRPVDFPVERTRCHCESSYRATERVAVAADAGGQVEQLKFLLAGDVATGCHRDVPTGLMIRSRGEVCHDPQTGRALRIAECSWRC